MQEKLFKTVAFGGFDKEAVLVYIRDLLSEHEKTLTAKNEELAASQSRITELVQEAEKLNQLIQQLKQKDAQLEKDLNQAKDKQNQLEKSLLLKEDKLADTETQLLDMKKKMEIQQQNTRRILDESNRRMQEELLKAQKEADQKVKEAQQNAMELFVKIDHEYIGYRKKYTDMVNAINELARYVDDAQKKVNERISALPESLISSDHE